jgi:hypothetical protein
MTVKLQGIIPILILLQILPKIPMYEDSHRTAAYLPPAHHPLIVPPFLVRLCFLPPVRLSLSIDGRGGHLFFGGAN